MRVKTNVRDIAGSANSSVSSARFLPGSTRITLCETRSAVVATGATETFAGLISSSSARRPISFGMVAEKNRFCRRAAQLLHDAADRHDEAQVEHLVGLVEHEDLGALELDIALHHVVDEAAGRGD